MELTHVRLLVDNYKECYLFYRDILGFQASWGDENSAYVEFESAGTKLGLFERKKMAEVTGVEYQPVRNRSDKVALIFSVENVEETYNKLKEKVKFVTEPTAQEGWGIKVAHFRDPAGSLIEIYESLEQVGDNDG